jgi:hypothetical protein
LTSLNLDISNAYGHHQAMHDGRGPVVRPGTSRRPKSTATPRSRSAPHIDARTKRQEVRIDTCGRRAAVVTGLLCAGAVLAGCARNRGLSARSAHRHGTVFIQRRWR